MDGQYCNLGISEFCPDCLGFNLSEISLQLFKSVQWAPTVLHVKLCFQEVGNILSLTLAKYSSHDLSLTKFAIIT